MLVFVYPREKFTFRYYKTEQGREGGGRHHFNCTTSVLIGKHLVSNSHSAWQPSSASTVLRSSSSGNQEWEMPPSVHVWGKGRGARKGPVFLYSDLCCVVHGVAVEVVPEKTTSLTIHWDKVQKQGKYEREGWLWEVASSMDPLQKMWPVLFLWLLNNAYGWFWKISEFTKLHTFSLI